LDGFNFNNLLGGLISSTTLTTYVNQIVDLVGADATEQKCEAACLEVVHNDVIDTACPFICTSLQSLAQNLHIDVTEAPASLGKRMFLDSFSFDGLINLFGKAELTHYVNQIVDTVGSDATEQQCEEACLKIVNNDLFDTACPFMCTSLQSLAQHLHLEEAATSAPVKRMFLDSFSLDGLVNLFGKAELTHYVNQIVDTVGSDATEQQCEEACLAVMNNDVLDTACPFMCTSLQSLAVHLHIEEGTTKAPAKRMLLDSFSIQGLVDLFGHAELTTYVNQIVDLVGSDATEQQCESACIQVINNDIFDTACPFMCSSFQALIHRFHMGSDATQAPAK